MNEPLPARRIYRRIANGQELVLLAQTTMLSKSSDVMDLVTVGNLTDASFETMLKEDLLASCEDTGETWDGKNAPFLEWH